jgi:hypothetical protein
MIVVPLFLSDPPGGPDASHCINAPGGYEFWQIDAVDDANKIELSVRFFDGHPSLPAYLRRYRRYRRRPTANAPPTPADFPVVEIQVRKAKGARVSALQVLPRGSLRSSTERLDISAGLHSLRRSIDRSLELRLAHPRCEAELTLVAQSTTMLAAVRCENGEFVFDGHPQCSVTGTMRLTATAVEQPAAIQFSGRGSHEHRWRVAPSR